MTTVDKAHLCKSDEGVTSMIQLHSLPDQGSQLPYFITSGADQMIRIFEYNLYKAASPKNNDSEAAAKPDNQQKASEDIAIELPKIPEGFEDKPLDQKIKLFKEALIASGSIEKTFG